MTDFHVDKRDIQFALFEQFKLADFSRMPRYKDGDQEFYEMILDQAIKLAATELAPLNELGDREGVRLKEGKVYLPEAFTSAYKTFCEGGWLSVARNPEYGGMGMPHLLMIATTEIFCAANPSFLFTPGLTDAAAHLIEHFAIQEHKDLFLTKMYTGEWTGTMCLTEPQAGSSVGDLSTKAAPVEGQDYYHISGNKIFISSGDHQMTDNIVHLVLARVVGDAPGTRGISLFMVPKNRINQDGTVGSPNDVVVSSVEHKMGIHASATCSLSFGDNGQCQGWLVGERSKGLAYMFQMMNEARLITGLQGAALANEAYQLALAYAKERKQGPKVTDRQSDAQSVSIIEHPDVRRNLMTMKAYSEAMRAMCFRLGALSDWSLYSEDEEARAHAEDLVELLTPIAKAYCSDMGFRVTEIAIQVHGGYGYIKEYGVEQVMRDAKIASIYEGTNGIQALDLLGRKMRAKNGGVFLRWLQDINAQLQSWQDSGIFPELAHHLDAAKNALAHAAFGFGPQGKEDPEYPLLHATPFLKMFGHVECARLLLEQAVLSYEKLQPIWHKAGVDGADQDARNSLARTQEDARFYEAKLHTAAFFINQVLPEVSAMLQSIQSLDRSALDVVL